MKTPDLQLESSSFHGRQVLVTGVTGFIGSHLALRLQEQGARVRGLARSTNKGDWLAARGIDIVAGDLTAADSLCRAVHGCSVVFSVAGWGGRGAAREMAQRVNVDGIRSLAEAAVEAGACRLVHTSSIAAYGLHASGVIDEDWPLRPTDAYGATKAQGEAVVLGFADRIEVSILRPGQVFGPRRSTWTTSLFDAVWRGLPVLVGGGHGSFHPCYIDNLIDGYLLAAAHPQATGEAFNFVDETTTWREFIYYYARMLARPARSIPIWPVKWALGLAAFWYRLTRQPSPVPDGALAFVTGSCRFSTAKARRLLGWTPRVPLAEGMRLTETWLRETGRLGRSRDRL